MKRMLAPMAMFTAGPALGVMSRLLDIYTQNPGNIFSRFAIWILIGTVISVFSKTKKRAVTGSCFCGMDYAKSHLNRKTLFLSI